uniref:Agmatinase (putative) n=1 Tax=Hucho hucho TaxID=62062 RepID=A0A4W5NYH1_9TELE
PLTITITGDVSIFGGGYDICASVTFSLVSNKLCLLQAIFGHRQIRAGSAMLRIYNSGTRAVPYESLMVADTGYVNVYEAYRTIVATGFIHLTIGGDHTIAYRILQAVAEKHGPVGLIHVDAQDWPGTPFRHCEEKGLLDCKRVVQIDLCGTGYSPEAYEWSRGQGFRVVHVEECCFKSLAPLMAEIRTQMGTRPFYLSFEILGNPALDPAFAPGTGMPETAGLTHTHTSKKIPVFCDPVEVSPPYDTRGTVLNKLRMVCTAVDTVY